MNLSTRLRPNRWEDIKGQDEAVSLFKKWIECRRSGKPAPHALLLAGETGCGKTSLARLFGLSLNCENLKKGYNPCLKCNKCKILLDYERYYSSNNIHMLDCNRSNGIQSVKFILKETQLYNYFPLPLVVLDEAHALTPQAKNMLLKPLEADQNHFIWVFITSEPDKFNKQLLTRLHPVPLNDINRSACMKILKSASIKLDFDYNISDLREFSKKSGNNPRSALALLQNYIDLEKG